MTSLRVPPRLQRRGSGGRAQWQDPIRTARARCHRVHWPLPPRPRLSRRVALARRHRVRRRPLVIAGSPTAEPPAGAPSSRTPVAAGPASAGPTAPAVVPVACLEPHIDFEIGRWLVTAVDSVGRIGLAIPGRAAPSAGRQAVVIPVTGS